MKPFSGASSHRAGLVLEGGAMRGLFTAGVLDAFYEAGVRFDGIVGVSAGAAFGCNYKSGQPGRVLRYNKRFCQEPRYCSWRSWLKTGDLFGAEFCYHVLPNELDLFDRAAFAADPTEFHIVCTDAETGEAVYHQCSAGDDKDFDWMRASASMPLVSRAVELDGKKYLDGAVADSIPLEYFERLGFSRNVVILTQPAGYVKHPPRGLRLFRQFLAPRFAEVLAKRHEMYNAQLRYVEERAREGKILLIRPEAPLPVRRLCHDPAKLQAAYDIGYAMGERRLAEVRTFLA